MSKLVWLHCGQVQVWKRSQEVFKSSHNMGSKFFKVSLGSLGWQKIVKVAEFLVTISILRIRKEEHQGHALIHMQKL